MTIKLGNAKRYSFSEVKEKETGQGKFVTFQWIIPLPMFLPVKRLSRVYFIEKEGDARKYAQKYNLLNYLFGWWGLPFGPIYLFKSVRINSNGGIDVTDDVYLNLNESDFNNGIVNISKRSMVFIHPKKSEVKEFQKVFRKLLSDGIISSSPLIGYYVNTKEGEKPYYLIRMNEAITEELEKKITNAIYKRFYKQLQFKLVELDKMGERKSKFEQQGLLLDCS